MIRIPKKQTDRLYYAWFHVNALGLHRPRAGYPATMLTAVTVHHGGIDWSFYRDIMRVSNYFAVTGMHVCALRNIGGATLHCAGYITDLNADCMVAYAR